ncbi:MAG TPA: RNA methyltransferase [Pyrinomonadaceae bacterium]|nr:RNA methyltransferase [Pyrinomonadaceae bacterium]
MGDGPEIIRSRRNPLAQRARAVREGREKGSVFVEGVRLCEEAARASLDFEAVLHTPALARDERGARLLADLRGRAARLFAADEAVLDFVADTKTAQGVVAVARRPRIGPEVVERRGATPLVVVMHRVNNPSNAGAMLRVAEAAGATAAVSTAGSTDLFSPKALRGAMGSAFRLPLWTGAPLAEVLEWCAARGVRAVAAAASAARAHTELDWAGPRAVLMGPEAGGLSETEAAAAGERVRIPMRAPVESLNVAVALGVILYEAARQRNFF